MLAGKLQNIDTNKGGEKNKCKNKSQVTMLEFSNHVSCDRKMAT